MASQSEKLSLSAATTVRYSCGLAETQSFCICVLRLAENAAKYFKKLQGVRYKLKKVWEPLVYK